MAFRWIKIFSPFFWLVWSEVAWAGPCCSAGGGKTALMMGHQQAQLEMGVSSHWLVGESTSSGENIFYTETKEWSGEASFSGSLRLSHHLQFSLSLPVAMKQASRADLSDEAYGLGDLRLGLGYEAYQNSEHDFRAFVYASITAPTGRSKNESNSRLEADALGKGFWTPGAGFILLKQFQSLDLSLSAEGRYSIPRNFDRAGQNVYVETGFGTSAGINAGYTFVSLKDFRMGGRVTSHWQSGERNKTDLSDRTLAARYVWDLGVDASIRPTPSLGLSLSYTDQTILGPTQNTKLARSLGFSLSYYFL